MLQNISDQITSVTGAIKRRIFVEMQPKCHCYCYANLPVPSSAPCLLLLFGITPQEEINWSKVETRFTFQYTTVARRLDSHHLPKERLDTAPIALALLTTAAAHFNKSRPPSLRDSGVCPRVISWSHVARQHLLKRISPLHHSRLSAASNLHIIGF